MRGRICAHDCVGIGNNARNVVYLRKVVANAPGARRQFLRTTNRGRNVVSPGLQFAQDATPGVAGCAVQDDFMGISPRKNCVSFI